MYTYKTSEIAKMIGIHPNTVRLYENLELISAPIRRANGYRVFTDLHLEQLKLIRLAFQIEVLQNGLRKKVITIVKTSAAREFAKAIGLTDNYINDIKQEQNNAEEAIESVKELLEGRAIEDIIFLKRKETAELLHISMDTLRNWELNGLLTVKRSENGYRIYTSEDIRMLKIIRSLRCGNYSLTAILRMLIAISDNPEVDIKDTIDTPRIDEDIISVCDSLLTSLENAERNAYSMRTQLKKMKKEFNNLLL